MIAIIDYGAGNLQSVEKALTHIGCSCQVVSTPQALATASAAVLPGVGAFGQAMKSLGASGLDRAIRDFVAAEKPFLGICLGLQVLFESSEESPGVAGLGLLKGQVHRLPAESGLKIPHIGWNSLDVCRPGWLLQGLKPQPFVYFVHSYYLQAHESVVSATANYGALIHAAVEKENLAACQFHPEKSGDLGLEILRNFAQKAANTTWERSGSSCMRKGLSLA